MKPDLIFHIVEKKDYKKQTKDGRYIPESIEQHGFIHCSTGSQINDTAERHFKKRRHLLLLIIDTKRIEAPLKYERSEERDQDFPHIYGPLNRDAVLDVITLNLDTQGKFNVEFTSN